MSQTEQHAYVGCLRADMIRLVFSVKTNIVFSVKTNTVNPEIFARVLFLRNFAFRVKYNPREKEKSFCLFLILVNYVLVANFKRRHSRK